MSEELHLGKWQSWVNDKLEELEERLSTARRQNLKKENQLGLRIERFEDTRRESDNDIREIIIKLEEEVNRNRQGQGAYMEILKERLDKLEKALEDHYHYADDGDGEKTASAIYILEGDSSSNLGSEGK